MQYLAILKVKRDVAGDRLAPHMKPEASKAWEMLAAGVLRSVHYIQGDHSPLGAALLLEVVDRNEAERQLKQLPLVEHGLVSVDIYALTPFTGFAALFARPGD